MRTKNFQPNSAQIRWREMVREQGCIFGRPGPVEIHHVAGQSASYQKVHLGNWWILPVSNEGHRMAEKMSYAEQKELFLDIVGWFVERRILLPFDAETLYTIMAWKR